MKINKITGEGYGSMLLIKVIRGNGSYTGDIGILDADSHSQMIQLGSVNPISD